MSTGAGAEARSTAGAAGAETSRPGGRPASPERRALPFAVLLFSLVGAHGLLETARDSLYLGHEPISRLPWVYLAVIAAVLLVSPLQSRLARAWTGPLTLSLTLIASALLTLAFWLFAAGAAAVNALYVWAALFSSLVFAQFWVNVDEAYNVGDAKKVFGFIAGAGLLGGAFGAATARLTLGFAPPRVLLLISGGLMLAGGVTVAAFSRAWRGCAHPVQTDVPVLRVVPRETMPDPYLRLLMGLAVVTAVAATLVDYLFKAAVATQVASERMPVVIADTYVVQSIVALGVELVVVRTLLGSAGVTRSLLLLPVALLGATAGFLSGNPLAFGICLKVLDGGLRPSLHRVTSELLFLPVPPAKRRLLKPSIDVLGQRGGQLLAALLLLAAQPMGGAMALVAVGIAVTALAWMWVSQALRPRYLALFRDQLNTRRFSWSGGARLDLGAAETLVAALGSVDQREVLAAMSLLAHHGRLGLVPALILHHPDAAVVRAALEHFAGVTRRDVDAFLPRLREHPDEVVRAIAVERWLAAGNQAEDLRAALGDASPVVRTAALIALSGTTAGGDALVQAQAIAHGSSLEERRALARAIADAPRSDLVDLLHPLFASGDLEIRREVVRACQRLALPRFVEDLTSLLAEPELRAGARDALLATGDAAFERLSALLLSDTTPYPVAREIPPTLARFPAERAAPVLLRRLALSRGGLDRFRTLRALNQLRRAQRGLPLQRKAVEAALRIDLSTVFKDRALRAAAERFGVSEGGPAGVLLLEMLAEKEALAIERVFRELQLFLPEEQVEQVYRAVKSGRPELHAAAVELLQGLLPRLWREPVLALVEREASAPEPYRVPWTEEELKQPALFVAALLDHSSQIVRAMAAQLAAERGWVDAVPALTAAAGRSDDDTHLIGSALERLGHPEQAHA